MLKPAVPKSRPDLFARLTDIAEKQVPARLKPIVAPSHVTPLRYSRFILPAPRAGHLEMCAVALCGRRSPPKRSPVVSNKYLQCGLLRRGLKYMSFHVTHYLPRTKHCLNVTHLA